VLDGLRYPTVSFGGFDAADNDASWWWRRPWATWGCRWFTGWLGAPSGFKLPMVATADLNTPDRRRQGHCRLPAADPEIDVPLSAHAYSLAIDPTRSSTHTRVVTWCVPSSPAHTSTGPGGRG
jgi:hypothetical protein